MFGPAFAYGNPCPNELSHLLFQDPLLAEMRWFLNAVNDSSPCRHLIPPMQRFTHSDLEQWHEFERTCPTSRFWCVYNPQRQPIALAELRDIGPHRERANVDLLFRNEAHWEGCTRHILRALAYFAFYDLGLLSLRMEVLCLNEDALQGAYDVGFSICGQLPSACHIGNEAVASIICVLTPDNWVDAPNRLRQPDTPEDLQPSPECVRV